MKNIVLNIGFNSVDEFYKCIQKNLGVSADKVDFKKQIGWFILNDNIPSRINKEDFNYDESFCTLTPEGHKVQADCGVMGILGGYKLTNRNKLRNNSGKGPYQEIENSDIFEKGHIIAEDICSFIPSIEFRKRKNLFWETKYTNRQGENETYVSETTSMLSQRIVEVLIENVIFLDQENVEKEKIKDYYTALGIANRHYKLDENKKLIYFVKLIYANETNKLASAINFQSTTEDGEFQFNVLLPHVFDATAFQENPVHLLNYETGDLK